MFADMPKATTQIQSYFEFSVDIIYSVWKPVTNLIYVKNLFQKD